MCDRPQRERKQAINFSVPEGRQTGHREGSAADVAARAARRGQLPADRPAMPQFHPGAAGHQQRYSAARKKQRRSSNVGGSPAKKRGPRSGGLWVVELDDASPPASAAAAPATEARVERCSVAAQGVYYTSAEAGGHQAPDGPESREEHTHTSLGQCRAPN